MKRKQPSLFLDQYGFHVFAHTVKELRERCGGGRVQKIYADTESGTVHIGYCVGNRWFNEFAPVVREVK